MFSFHGSFVQSWQVRPIGFTFPNFNMVSSYPEVLTDITFNLTVLTFGNYVDNDTAIFTLSFV